MSGEGTVPAGHDGRSAARHPSLDDRYDPAIRMVDHDPAWHGAALAELARIKLALGGLAVRLDHVGSTAVPGLVAKPVLDLQVTVPAMEPSHRYVPALERLGYLYAPDPASPDHRFFGRPAARPRSHHVHVCEAGSPHDLRHRAVRDFLRAHPAEVVRYAALKRDLAATHPGDRIAYIDGKAPYMADLQSRALAWLATVA